MRNTEINTLPNWWWPGQWLRIVYAVWVDQRWYWHHVRPWLDEPRRRRALTLQALLGAALIAVVLNLALYNGMSWLSEGSLGHSLPWWLLVRASLGFVCTIITSAMLGMTLSGSVTLGLPSSLICTFAPFLPGDLPGLLALVIVITTISGLAFGIARVVATGDSWSRFENSALALLIIVDGVADERIVLGLIQAIVLMAASFAGSSWATRQVPNPEQRKQFAHPRTSWFSLFNP